MAVLMLIERQEKYDERDFALRLMMAQKGGNLSLLFPKDFPEAQPERIDDLPPGDEPVEIVFDEEVSLEEAMAALREMTMTAEEISEALADGE